MMLFNATHTHTMAFSIESDKIYHLLSNAQPHIFHDNRANAFTNRVPILHIPHGDTWEVGLKEFSCVNTLQTIPRDLTFYACLEGKVKHAYTISKGLYNETTLLTHLNRKETEFHFSLQKVAKKSAIIQVQTKNGYSLQLDPLLADILGVPPTIPKDCLTKANTPLNLKAFTYNIVVYCDLVQESMVGGQREKILRVIPFTSSQYMDVFHVEFMNIDFVDVTRDTVQDIHIRLMTDYGEPMPLVDGRSYVKLHFRRKFR